MRFKIELRYGWNPETFTEHLHVLYTNHTIPFDINVNRAMCEVYMVLEDEERSFEKLLGSK